MQAPQEPTGADLFEQLVATSRIAIDSAATAAARAALTAGKARLLSALPWDGKTIRQVDLARRLRCSPGNVSHLVQGLLREGLVDVVVLPSILNARLVGITAKGRERIAGSEARQAATAEEVATVLTAEERRTLSTLLSKLRAAVDGPEGPFRGVGRAGDTNPWLDPFVAREVQDVMHASDSPEPPRVLDPAEPGMTAHERWARTCARDTGIPIEEARIVFASAFEDDDEGEDVNDGSGERR